MITRFTLFAVAVGFVCASGMDAAEPAPAPRVKSDPFDVLYLAPDRPVVMRLQITTDDKPLDEAWGRFVDTLFTKLDADKSGSLDAKELGKLRPMLTLLTGRNMPASTNPALRSPVTRESLAAYLRQNDLGPLRLPPVVNNPQYTRLGGFSGRVGGGLTSETIDKAFMELLDTNTDKKLSPKELTAGIEILGKLDTDENEMVSVDELLRRPISPYYYEEFDGRLLGTTVGPGVELRSLGRKVDTNLAKRLLARYGPKPAGNPNPKVKGGLPGTPTLPGTTAAPESTARRLTPKDLKINPEAFEALDQDGDGELDTEELARFGQSATPEVELAFRLGTLPAGTRPAKIITSGKSLKSVASERGTEVALEMPGVRLELIPAGTSAQATRTTFRSRYLNRFRAFDRDANGYLDSTEFNNDVVFRDLSSFLDANADGKIFEKELIAVLDEVDAVATEADRGIVSVDVAEAGRGLFGLIDSDGDGRMSVRELRALPKLIERFDADKDGFLSPIEVPRRFQATLRRGLTNVGLGQQFVSFWPGVPMANPRPPVGPMWFQKMDRNRDGDVSRREFLGTDEDFRKLDADADGLISPREAEAADKK